MPGKYAQPTIDKKPLEVDGITTADGLMAMGREYAYLVNKGIHITPLGHQHLTNQLSARAQQNLTEGNWHGVSGRHPHRPRQPGV